MPFLSKKLRMEGICFFGGSEQLRGSLPFSQYFRERRTGSISLLPTSGAPTEPLSLPVQGRPPAPPVALREPGTDRDTAPSPHTALLGGKAVLSSACLSAARLRQCPRGAPRPLERCGSFRGLLCAVLVPSQSQVPVLCMAHERQTDSEHM